MFMPHLPNASFKQHEDPELHQRSLFMQRSQSTGDRETYGATIPIIIFC